MPPAFSSVVVKPGQRLAPKAAPRRNVQRTTTRSAAAQKTALPTPGPSATSPATISSASPDENNEPTREAVPRSDSAIHHVTPSQFSPPPSITITGSSPAIFVDAPRWSERSLRSRASADDVQPAAGKIPNPIIPGAEQNQEITSLASAAIPRVSKRKQADTEIGDSVQQPTTSSVSATDSRQASSRKKRKPTAPEPSLRHILAHGRLAAPNQAQPQQSERTVSTPRSSRTESEPTASLLENAAASAAAVSDLANSIERQTSSRRRARTTQAPGVQVETAATEDSETESEARPIIMVKRPWKKRTAQEAAAEIVAATVSAGNSTNQQRKRNRTPDDAEEHEITPSEVKMGELCKDDRMGKKSSIEAEMQEVNWLEVKKQWKDQREAAREAKASRGSGMPRDTGAASAERPLAPGMLIVNGEIITNTETLVIDRRQDAEELAADAAQEVIEDRSITKRVNQLSVGKPPGLMGAPTRWDDDMTELFYKGLRMFGTDFMMIASLFPAYKRRHIKLKYVKEEKTNPETIKRHLANREPVEMSLLQSKNPKTEYKEDAKEFLERIAAETKTGIEKAQREEQAKANGEPHPDEGTVLQSREQGSADPGVDGEERDETVGPEVDPSAKENRFSSLARDIVRGASAAKKKRKQASAGKKKDAQKKSKRAMEGIEEMLGSVDEVER